MRVARSSAAASSAVALALAASLGGAPQLLALAGEEGEHRCGCPAGTHVCACPRCAAATRARASRRGGEHAARPGERSCCHGAPATSPPAPASPQRPDAPCVSASCGGRGPAATLAGEADPFVVPRQASAPRAGRGEGFATLPLLRDGAAAAPEPPPPRA